MFSIMEGFVEIKKADTYSVELVPASDSVYGKKQKRPSHLRMMAFRLPFKYV